MLICSVILSRCYYQEVSPSLQDIHPVITGANSDKKEALGKRKNVWQLVAWNQQRHMVQMNSRTLGSSLYIVIVLECYSKGL